MMAKLTQKYVKADVYYNSESGLFYRKKIIKKIGGPSKKPLGTKTKGGYLICCVSGKLYYLHRLAWLYIHGYFPENDIDHIDRDRTNNKISNLREVSRQCNLRNGNQIKGTSKIKGVNWVNREQKWNARLSLNNHHKSLGNYENFDDAVCARLAGEQCLGWAGCDSNTPAYQYVQNNIINN